MPFSKEEINKIVNFRDGFDKQLNIFELKSYVNVTDKNPLTAYAIIASDNINLELKDFEDCTTEEEVRDTFEQQLAENIKANLTKNL